MTDPVERAGPSSSPDLGDRMAAQNTALEGRDASLEELEQVYGPAGVARLYEAGDLTAAQADAYAGKAPA